MWHKEKPCQGSAEAHFCNYLLCISYKIGPILTRGHPHALKAIPVNWLWILKTVDEINLICVRAASSFARIYLLCLFGGHNDIDF